MTTRPTADAPYRVELDAFCGPLDLLLHLVRREEVDVHDIPIATITERYLEATGLDAGRHGDPNAAGPVGVGTFHGDFEAAGEFVVMAATLLEIKSATLLPRPDAADRPDGTLPTPWVDPRRELIEQLLAYQRGREAAALLTARREAFESRFPRVPAAVVPADTEDAPPLDLEDVGVWDLLDAFARLLRETGTRPPRVHEVIDDETPLEQHAADIEARLREAIGQSARLTLRQLVAGRRSRSEVVGVFLALLELVRQGKVRARQASVREDVEIVPIDTGDTGDTGDSSDTGDTGDTGSEVVG